MDIRWLWTLGVISCLLLDMRAASSQDALAYSVPGRSAAAASVFVELVPLSPARTRTRRYLAGEESASAELSSGGGGSGGGGPRYENPLSGAEGEAGRYKTTAASAPAGPAPTAANVTEMGNAMGNVTTTLATSATNLSSSTVPSGAPPAPTVATAVSGARSGDGGVTSAQSPVPTAILPTQTSTATAAAAAGAAGHPVPATGGQPPRDISGTVTETEAATSADDSNDPDRYPQIFTNQTFKSHNISRTDEDHHLYYNSTTVTDAALAHKLWMELANRKEVHINPMLSQSHRRASTVQLSFDFPFYGHPVRNVTVATGGFVYMGDFIHSWLAATQYVAPLMANFDTSISDHSFVKYLDNGTAFTVQWENVHLQDRAEAGGFSFQLTLHRSGDIVFVYRDVPLPVEEIADYHHPVKVGISDAYIIDRNVFFVRRKTIYEYHRVAFNHEDIQNGTVIVLSALPTCRSAPDCVTCLTGVQNFQCQWCKGMCSDGMDRRRQEWLQHSCDKQGLASVEQCPPPATRDQHALPTLQPVSQPHAGGGDGGVEAAVHASQSEAAHSEPQRTDGGLHMNGSPSSSSVSVSGVVAILSVVTLVCATGVWILYAYRNPHTASGQFLIRYRPSQWSWRRGEARYTAATIHM
ncbi:plexin domain-containing protein 1 [Schistocerca piceifrons]|uniref:plexin domain-containing protein 1 n=1 Tax=Schistocerca piceifrons TaxID=274613 RepID=UPI001F5E748A|nr:plexin domain-containing protein 1 [Schistocerca piceifrons]